MNRGLAMEEMCHTIRETDIMYTPQYDDTGNLQNHKQCDLLMKLLPQACKSLTLSKVKVFVHRSLLESLYNGISWYHCHGIIVLVFCGGIVIVVDHGIIVNAKLWYLYRGNIVMVFCDSVTMVFCNSRSWNH